MHEKSSQEFLDFISKKGKNGEFVNLEMLLKLEKEYPLILSKVMVGFEEAKKRKNSLDENGVPVKKTWEEAFKEFYKVNKYLGVEEENEDIAKLFGEKGLSQEVFDMATQLRIQAEEEHIPEHILEKDIKEETILEGIERIKKQTEKELEAGKKGVEELYEKQFTYEWLSKKDPHNFILGLFCSCCGTITSSLYGKNIAISTVLASDVQNLVIRNQNGEIISKGTMYVNKEKGYAVINDFELNKKYTEHEREVGRYDVPADSIQEQERERIFEAFQRGLKEFIKEYDIKNPGNPLKQINIGMGFNRLKKQVERFEKETSNLTVPLEYDFEDARKEQFILYKREEKQIENEGEER